MDAEPCNGSSNWAKVRSLPALRRITSDECDSNSCPHSNDDDDDDDDNNNNNNESTPRVRTSTKANVVPMRSSDLEFGSGSKLRIWMTSRI